MNEITIIASKLSKHLDLCFAVEICRHCQYLHVLGEFQGVNVGFPNRRSMVQLGGDGLT